MARGVAKRRPAGRHLVLHDCGGREPHLEPGSAHATDHFAVTTGKIIARGAVEGRVKQAEFFEDPFRKREVGTHGRMFRLEGAEVGTEGEGRVPLADPFGQAIGENRNDLAADSTDAARLIGEQRHRDLREPVGLHENIIVAEDDDFTACLGERAVARMVKALLRFVQVARSGMSGGKLGDDRTRVVAGIVVDDENLEVIAGKMLLDEPRQRLAQKVSAIVGRNRDGDFEGGGRI